MRFTGLNDVAVRHVAPHVVEDLERSVHDLRWCAEALRDDATARDVVKGVLRDEQRHLLVLREELNAARESEAPNQRPNSLTPITPTMRDAYGDALNRWTNEGGALVQDDLAVRTPHSPRQGSHQRRIVPSRPRALRA